MSKKSRKTSAPAKATPVKATPVKDAAPAKKSYGTLIALIVVLVVAVAVIGWMMNSTNNLNAQVDSLTGQLTTAQEDLNNTIAAKDSVEDELSAAQEALDEANLTLEESTARVATLEADLATLQAENAANVEQIAVLTADLEAAQAANATAQVAVDDAMAALLLAQSALNGTPVVEEPVVEEPVVEEPVVDEPVVLPEVQYPIVNVTDEGTVIETEAAVVTLRVDENNAIAFLTATVNGEPVSEDVTALFIGKTTPVNAEEFTLDEAGIVQAIIDALNVMAEPEFING